jgi:hypothetical protein
MFQEDLPSTPAPSRQTIQRQRVMQRCRFHDDRIDPAAARAPSQMGHDRRAMYAPTRFGVHDLQSIQHLARELLYVLESVPTIYDPCPMNRNPYSNISRNYCMESNP